MGFFGSGGSISVKKDGSLVATRNTINIEDGPNIVSTVTDTGEEINIVIEALDSASGEANTASNVGSGSGIFKSKTGVDLAFKSLIVGSNKLSLTANTNDLTFDINEANLTLSNMGGTLGIAHGGTGQTTATAALNVLLPSQTGNGGYFLQTDGLGVISWASASASSITASSTDTLTNKTMDGGSNTFTNISLTSSVTGILPVANGGTGANDASGARTNLGLGSLAVLSNVNNSNWSGTALSVSNGGTGQTSFTNGQLLIGNTTGNTLTKATLTAGSTKMSITNGAGSITLDVNQANLDKNSLGGSALSIANGGTGSTTAKAARQALATYHSNYILLAADTTLDATYDGKIISVSASAASRVITLPDANTVGVGWTVTILRNNDNTTNTVTINRAGTDTITGDLNSTTTLTLANFETLTLMVHQSGGFLITHRGSRTTVNQYSKGSLLTFNGNSYDKIQPLSVGSNNQVLIADSAQTSGIKWGTVPIAGGGTGQTTAQGAIDALLPSQTSNSGKFLTTNGTTSSWATASGTMVLLGSYTVSTPVAQVDFQNGVGGIVIDPATYITYFLVGRDILLSADNHLYFRFFQSGSIVASGTPYGYRTSSQDTGTAASTAAQIQMTRVGLDSATGKMSGFTGEIILGGADMDYFVWKGIGYNTASGLEAYFGGGYLDTAGTTDGFRLTPASGNFVSGKFLLYGIKS